jgi:hypothetical protein
MSWCPECGAEYREGYTQCSECQVALVDTPPASVAAAPGLVEVRAFESLEQAELAQGLLETNGIEAEIEDTRVPHPELGYPVGGEVALLVGASEVEQARALLGEADRGELAVDADAAAQDNGDTPAGAER